MATIIEIFTDGACRGNPGPGGWGVVLRGDGEDRTFYGGESYTTNNRMELTAAIKALESLNTPHKIQLFTDSQYLKKGVCEWLAGWKTRGWMNAKREPVKNVDLWKALDQLAAQHDIVWHWVKAHSGHFENEQADALANQAIDELMA